MFAMLMRSSADSLTGPHATTQGAFGLLSVWRLFPSSRLLLLLSPFSPRLLSGAALWALLHFLIYLLYMYPWGVQGGRNSLPSCC